MPAASLPPLPHDRANAFKRTCCGGAVAFSEPEKSQARIKNIIETAYDGGADLIVTPARCAG